MTTNDHGVLDGALCYLIGAIEFSSDQGVGWRKKIVSLCQNASLNIKFLDPTNKILGLKEEIGNEANKIKQYKIHEQWNDLSLAMKIIVRQDHRCVDLSDFVIFYLDPSVHHCGSYFEFQSAMTQKKPYYIIVPGGKLNAPSWLFGICDHMCIFSNIESVVEDLARINSGLVELPDRWVLFRKQLSNL